MKVVALIGEPASGKTTVTRRLIEELGPHVSFQYKTLKALHFTKTDVYVLGIYDGDKFDGTDRLSMAVQPDAEWFVYQKCYNGSKATIFFEGDRLGNFSFLAKCAQLVPTKIFLLSAPEPILESRHTERSDNQSETFLKSRRTKILNIKNALGVEEILNEKAEDLPKIVAKVREEITRRDSPEPLQEAALAEK